MGNKVEKKRIVAFDFDGTLTRKDTLLEFIRFVFGDYHFLLGIFLYSPMLIAYKLGLYPNWKAKEKIFTFFFKGMKHEAFADLGKQFYDKHHDSLLYKQAERKVQEHLSAGDTVVIISASIEEWVRPFADALGVQFLLTTKAEYTSQHRLTGRFCVSNCYGQEKVTRLLSLFPDRDEYFLIAYGDSRGDKELLNFADNSYYKLFKE